MILVGNKADLESERQVSKQDAEALANKWGCKFMETSAKQTVNVEAIFHEVVRQIKAHGGTKKVCILDWTCALKELTKTARDFRTRNRSKSVFLCRTYNLLCNTYNLLSCFELPT